MLYNSTEYIGIFCAHNYHAGDITLIRLTAIRGVSRQHGDLIERPPEIPWTVTLLSY